MDSRLQQFLSAENMTQSEFADRIGIARASVSHILAGRNKPSIEMIQKLSESFPSLNLDWFINGNGKMYKSDFPAAYGAPNSASGQEQSLFDIESEFPANGQFEPHSPAPKVPTPYKERQIVKNQRSVVRVLVFFDDGTFQELNYKPR